MQFCDDLYISVEPVVQQLLTEWSVSCTLHEAVNLPHIGYGNSPHWPPTVLIMIFSIPLAHLHF